MSNSFILAAVYSFKGCTRRMRLEKSNLITGTRENSWNHDIPQTFSKCFFPQYYQKTKKKQCREEMLVFLRYNTYGSSNYSYSFKTVSSFQINRALLIPFSKEDHYVYNSCSRIKIVKKCLPYTEVGVRKQCQIMVWQSS